MGRVKRVSLVVAVYLLVVLVAASAVAFEQGRPSAPETPPSVPTATAAPIKAALEAREKPRASRERVTRAVPTVSPRPTVIVGEKDPHGPAAMRSFARKLVPAGQWACLDRLWQGESGWDATKVGPRNTDGRYPVGIPQLKGLKVSDGARYQVTRGLAYIEHRYGSPCAALAHSDRHDWY